MKRGLYWRRTVGYERVSVDGNEAWTPTPKCVLRETTSVLFTPFMPVNAARRIDE